MSDKPTADPHLSPPTEFDRGRYGWPDLFWATGDMAFNQAMAWCEHHRSRSEHLQRRIAELEASSKQWRTMYERRLTAPPSGSRELLAEVWDALRKAWDARNLPASVISYDLTQRVYAHLGAAATKEAICKTCAQTYFLGERHDCPGLQSKSAHETTASRS